jgi:hypothetical protein
MDEATRASLRRAEQHRFDIERAQVASDAWHRENAADSIGGRRLIGPPHAHLDAPCTDECYEEAGWRKPPLAMVCPKEGREHLPHIFSLPAAGARLLRCPGNPAPMSAGVEWAYADSGPIPGPALQAEIDANQIRLDKITAGLHVTVLQTRVVPGMLQVQLLVRDGFGKLYTLTMPLLKLEEGDKLARIPE